MSGSGMVIDSNVDRRHVWEPSVSGGVQTPHPPIDLTTSVALTPIRPGVAREGVQICIGGRAAETTHAALVGKAVVTSTTAPSLVQRRHAAAQRPVTELTLRAVTVPVAEPLDLPTDALGQFLTHSTVPKS